MITTHGVKAWFDAPRYKREDAIRALESVAAGDHHEGCTCAEMHAWADPAPLVYLDPELLGKRAEA